MPTEFKVILDNRPGALAELGETLGAARVNVEALLALASGDRGVVHLVATDPQAAERALESAGFTYSSRRVIVVRILDQPGELADVARVMADANINIDVAYVTTAGHVVLGVDDFEGARQVASGLAVATI